MSTILSGEKMVLAHSKTNYELPLIGVKDFKPNHSWLEQKQIQSALDSRKTLLEAERVEKECNLMTADWKPEKHKAAVTRKGKHWETFGHHSDSSDWLFPEEVLFLMEMNCLECFYNEVPLSLQKAYSVLIKPENGCTLNEYRVFAHLCRAGYRVLRHLPNLTVTAYERTIRLDQHLKERKTYDDVVSIEEIVPEEPVTSSSGKEGNEENMEIAPLEERTAPDVSVSEDVAGEKTEQLKQSEITVTEKTEIKGKKDESVKGKIIKTKKSVGALTKRKLLKTQRRNAKWREKLKNVAGCDFKKSQALRILQKSKLFSVVNKCLPLQTKSSPAEDLGEVQTQREIEHNPNREISSTTDTEDGAAEIPSERWQPPVVITDLPENIEMTIGSAPVKDKDDSKEKETILVIDIADTSSEEEEETDEVESDSDIEIIEEIRPPHNNLEEEEEDEDDLEIIEVPVPQKEIIVETLSSDSEEEGGGKGSDSDSEKSYDGNWKRSSPKKKTFVRPPTMSHFTFAAIDEFCAEKNATKENINGEESNNRNTDDSDDLVRKRPVYPERKLRNEILDLMPTMAGQNRKLMTLDSPDLRLIPDNIIPKQQAYTYSTNALRARVFRQGFRGRRNFHGPRFTSYNPYYNNTNGNFFPNQLSVGGPQALFQSPQLTQMLGGGDISAVTRGVMQIATALLMNLPQSNMNNGLLPLSQNNMNNVLLPYNPRPHFHSMHSNFNQRGTPRSHTPNFPARNQNLPYRERSNVNQGFNASHRGNSRLENLFDMPQQPNFEAPNHVRFTEDSDSTAVGNNQHSNNFSVDISRSSESDHNSSDHNFTPPIANNHRGNRSFRDNRAANFKRRGRFRGRIQNHRGGFSQSRSLEGTSSSSQWIDPAYIKPDVPIPGEQNSNSEGDFIPVRSSTSDSKPVEVISIDDNDDGFIPRGAISCRFMSKKQRGRGKRKRMGDGFVPGGSTNTAVSSNRRKKRKLMRLQQKAKKLISGDKNPEIVFLDSPTTSASTIPINESLLGSVKKENDTEVRVKSETESELVNVKQEEMETNVKQEPTQELGVKIENEIEKTVKTEGPSSENSEVKVKVEQRESGQNVRVEIKIESSSDTSSVVSLNLSNAVKEEQPQVKIESSEVSEVKAEVIDVVENVKTESLNELESKEGILEVAEETREVSSSAGEPMDTSDGDSERTMQIDNESLSTDQIENNSVVVEGRDISEGDSGNEMLCSRGDESLSTDQIESDNVVVEGRDISEGDSDKEVLCSRGEPSVSDVKKVSSWAEVKKSNIPLCAFQENDVQDQTEVEDGDELRPLLQPKHCKTVGSVLSALQIFTPFTAPPPEDVLRLKISFDMYLPTEFRKSHRGLPQYRIVVFGGTEPLPSPAQLREVNSRFQDQVPVLTAVVTPGSVVFYTFADVDLPVDTTSTQ